MLHWAVGRCATKVADIAACVPLRKSPNHLLAVCGVGGKLHKICKPLDNTTAQDNIATMHSLPVHDTNPKLAGETSQWLSAHDAKRRLLCKVNGIMRTAKLSPIDFEALVLQHGSCADNVNSA